VRYLELVKGVEPASIACAQRDPDRAAMADHQCRELSGFPHLLERREHPLLLLAQRLAIRKAECVARPEPGGVALRLAALDVGEQVTLPASSIGLTQPCV